MSWSAPREPCLVHAAHHAHNYRGIYFSVLGSALMAVVAIFQALSLLWWLFLILGALCALLGYILSGNKESNLHRISNALEKARKEKSTAQKALLEAIEHIDINLSKEVGLWSPEVRFTVYAHDRDNKRFIPIVRISDDPTIAKKNREHYPESQGYLGQTWRQGIHFHTDRHKRRVKRESLESGFTEKEYDSLTLIPRSLLGIRLHKGTSPIGAILWESEYPKRIDLEDDRLDNIKDNATFLDLQAVFAASTLLFSDLSEHFFKKSG